jgi:pilus assembly protein FimV
MFVKRSSLVLTSLMALPSAAFALGLGDIRLLSPLNAPLDAEIELVDVTPEEMQTLKAQIASRETFTRYGLDWPVFLSSVQVKTTRGADGRQIIKVKSADTITEPFITLLVEVNWARGRLVREYTMLLDPPVYTPGQSPATNAPVAAPAAGTGAHEGSIARGSPVPASKDTSSVVPTPPDDSAGAPSPTRAQTSGAGSSATAASGSSHVVKRGETLSSIAASASGSAADSAQTRSWMLAIYQANPGAFDKNMNLLRSGAVLRIPETSDVSAISPSEANGEIRRQYAAWRSSTPAAGSSTSAEPGRLRLVTPNASDSAGTGGSNAETKALQGRVKELEGQLNDSKRSLSFSRDSKLPARGRLRLHRHPLRLLWPQRRRHRLRSRLHLLQSSNLQPLGRKHQRELRPRRKSRLRRRNRHLFLQRLRTRVALTGLAQLRPRLRAAVFLTRSRTIGGRLRCWS